MPTIPTLAGVLTPYPTTRCVYPTQVGVNKWRGRTHFEPTPMGGKISAVINRALHSGPRIVVTSYYH